MKRVALPLLLISSFLAVVFSATLAFCGVIQGHVYYNHVIATPDSLSSTQTMQLPVRRASISLAAGGLDFTYADTTTDNDGFFSFSVPDDLSTFSGTIIVRAHTVASNDSEMDVVPFTSKFSSVFDLRSAYSQEFPIVFNPSITQSIDLVVPRGSASAYFNILDDITWGMDYVLDLLPQQQLPSLKVYWPNLQGLWTYYEKGIKKIFVARQHPFSDGVILHEFGHFIQDNISLDHSQGGNHNGSANDPRLAFSEGFATYFSSAVRWYATQMVNRSPQPYAYPCFYFRPEGVFDLNFDSLFQVAIVQDIERPLRAVTMGQTEEETVAAALWDMIDDPRLMNGLPDQSVCMASEDWDQSPSPNVDAQQGARQIQIAILQAMQRLSDVGGNDALIPEDTTFDAFFRRLQFTATTGQTIAARMIRFLTGDRTLDGVLNHLKIFSYPDEVKEEIAPGITEVLSEPNDTPPNSSSPTTIPGGGWVVMPSWYPFDLTFTPSWNYAADYLSTNNLLDEDFLTTITGPFNACYAGSWDTQCASANVSVHVYNTGNGIDPEITLYHLTSNGYAADAPVHNCSDPVVGCKEDLDTTVTIPDPTRTAVEQAYQSCFSNCQDATCQQSCRRTVSWSAPLVIEIAPSLNGNAHGALYGNYTLGYDQPASNCSCGP